MERCSADFSTQWKRVLGTFPHNGNMFRAGFPRCGKRARGEGQGARAASSAAMRVWASDRKAAPGRWRAAVRSR